jgi:hypothetical protein
LLFESLNTAARFLLPLVVLRFSTVAKDGFVDVLAAPGLVLLYLLGRKSAAALSTSFLFKRIFVIFEICALGAAARLVFIASDGCDTQPRAAKGLFLSVASDGFGCSPLGAAGAAGDLLSEASDGFAAATLGEGLEVALKKERNDLQSSKFWATFLFKVNARGTSDGFR